MYNFGNQIVSNIRNNNGVLEYQDAETGEWKPLKEEIDLSD